MGAGAVAAHPYYYMPYAGLQGRAEPNVDEATARYLINFGVFQMATATAAAVGTSGVSGTVHILQTSTTPVITDFVNAGLTAADTTTPKALHNGAAPSFQLFNRFTVKGSNTEFNIDAASAKRDVNDVGVGIFSRACDGISLGSDVAPATDVFDGTTDVFARSSSDFA